MLRNAAWICFGIALHAGAQAAPPTDPTAQTASLSWGATQIRASHIVFDNGLPVTAPARPLATVVVVESSGARLTVFDGDSLTLRGHVALRPNRIEGPLRFSPDGRFAYVGTQDGWVSQIDLWRLDVAAEVRTGESLRSLAISGDGQWLLAGHGQPHSLALLRSDLALERVYAVVADKGAASSSVAAVVDAALRERFVVALESLPELWEISYDPRTEDIYDGMVHDFRMGEGIPRPGFLGVRRIKLPQPLQALFIDPPQGHALGQSPPSPTGIAAAHVVNLDVRRRIEALPTADVPRLQSSAVFTQGDARLLATLGAGDGRLSVIDMRTWKRVAEIPTAGPGRQVRTHAQSAHLWTDSSLDEKGGGRLTVIHKARLEVVAQLSEPGLRLEHVDFSHDGREVFVSAESSTVDSASGGALIVFDAQSLKRLNKLALTRPGAVFNVGNEIARARGQLH